MVGLWGKQRRTIIAVVRYLSRLFACSIPGLTLAAALGGAAGTPPPASSELDLGAVRLPLVAVPEEAPCVMGESRPDVFTDVREQPAHTVRLRRVRFAGRHEVTNAEFAAFLNGSAAAGADAASESPRVGAWYDAALGSAEIRYVAAHWTVSSVGEHVPPARKEPAMWRVDTGRETRPVTGVSWHGARAFADWAARRTGRRVRLPTEAEWECLCRAGTATRFWWGDEPSHDRMNYSGVGGADRFDPFSQDERRAPVESFPANPWGLYDTHGNVWEWTEDVWFRRYTAATAGDPIEHGPGAHRIYRGGSYERHPWACRSATRRFGSPSRMTEDLGFRVVVE